MVLTGKFRRVPDLACSCFTLANIHVNNECAKTRSVRIALLLLIRDLFSKLSAVVLTGAFNKAVEWELPAGDPNRRRRLSSIEAAFNHASIPWPTLGVSPLWGPGAEPHGHMWLATSGLTVVVLL